MNKKQIIDAEISYTFKFLLLCFDFKRLISKIEYHKFLKSFRNYILVFGLPIFVIGGFAYDTSQFFVGAGCGLIPFAVHFGIVHLLLILRFLLLGQKLSSKNNVFSEIDRTNKRYKNKVDNKYFILGILGVLALFTIIALNLFYQPKQKYCYRNLVGGLKYGYYETVCEDVN